LTTKGGTPSSVAAYPDDYNTFSDDYVNNTFPDDYVNTFPDN